MTTHSIGCPHCRRSLKVPAKLMGRTVKCPACQGKIKLVVPTSQKTPAATPPSQPSAPPQPQSEATDTTRACPFCGEQIMLEAKKCKHCGEFFDRKHGIREQSVDTNVKQGALIGAVVCLVIGIALMCLTLWSALIYGPLFLAGFILSIVAMAQRRVVGGVTMLLLTVIVPPVLFFSLGVFRTSKIIEEVSKSMVTTEERGSPSPRLASGDSSVQTANNMNGNRNEGATPTGEDVAAESEEREKQEYLQVLQLYDLKAKYYTSIMDKRVPGVEFKLRNGGDKTLSRVEVTVYFLDAEGNIIAEEDYHPVLVSELSFGMRSDKPLKPKYIWQMEKGKFYQAKNVPSEWQEGNVQAEVTDVEFASVEETTPSGIDSPEKQAYLEQIDLYDFHAKYYSSIMDEQVPGVEFKLRNRGDRTLNEVEVTVYFMDATGKVISEEDYHPVLVSELSFGMRSDKPLKPKYIWQMERGKFYQAKNVPNEWNEGNAVASITGIEFAPQ